MSGQNTSVSGPAAKVSPIFASTHWSVVLAAGETNTAHSSAALAKLCEAYWYPLYAFVRRSGRTTHDAEDLIQEFFLRLLDKKSIASADPLRGRFRSFLLGALKHFLADEWDRARAQKRGGKIQIIALDAETAEGRYALEPVDARTPDKIFQQQWAAALLEQVLLRLQQELHLAG